MKSRLLLQIHDELLIETHLDEFEEVKEILQNENDECSKPSCAIKY